MSRAPRQGSPRSAEVAGRPAGIVHHGIRAALLIGLAGITTLLFPPDPRLRMEQYSVGMIANADITAEIRFDVPFSAEELESQRDEARASVPPTLDSHPEAVDTTAARLERFFGVVDQVGGEGSEAELRRALEERSIAATPDQIAILRDPASRTAIRRAALRATREILSAGVADAAELAGVATRTVTIRDPADGDERSVDRAVILSASEFLDRAVALLPADMPPSAQQLLRVILVQHVEHTLDLNVAATQLLRDQTARAVDTVKQTVLEGESVVRANEQVTLAVVERLAAYEEALRRQGLLSESVELRLTPLFGAGLLNLLILGVFWVFVFFFRGEVYDRTRWVLLVAGLIAVYLAGAAVVVRSDWPVEALPVVFSALAVAVLWDGRMALVFATMLAVLSSAQSGLQGLGVLIPTFVGGAAAGMSVRVVRRRSQTWVFIAFIFSAYAAAILALTMVFGGGLERLGVSLVAAAGNAVVSAILAMGFIPIFEMVTGITTDQTLLEWGDPNRPLLRRLSMEAPGTYAHTINVANLAEAAATAIGANGLLARVGLYYHDVGKMLKPHYFVENQPDGRNPHDRLKPDTSAAIVREHVTEGVKLAREEKVPDVIVDFIAEHHGTQRIGFFYERALKEYGEDAINEDDYAYPGPNPRSRETAIAMLADSAESATRVLKDPTPERIRELIDSVVESKIAAGQLESAPLTFRELTRIKDQFVKVLSGVYHHRIDYPETKHLTDAPGGGGPVGGSAEPPGRDPGEADAADGGGASADAEGGGSAGGRGTTAPPRRRPAQGAGDHPELPFGEDHEESDGKA